MDFSLSGRTWLKVRGSYEGAPHRWARSPKLAIMKIKIRSSKKDDLKDQNHFQGHFAFST